MLEVAAGDYLMATPAPDLKLARRPVRSETPCKRYHFEIARNDEAIASHLEAMVAQPESASKAIGEAL